MVAQGGHAAGAGDLEGDDGRRPGRRGRGSRWARVAPTVVLAAGAARVLATAAPLADAQAALTREIAPIDDLRSTA